MAENFDFEIDSRLDESHDPEDEDGVDGKKNSSEDEEGFDLDRAAAELERNMKKDMEVRNDGAIED